MKSIADRQSSPAQQDLPRVFDPSETIQNIRRLIWLYFWLLIFEGAFRKWILPQFSAPLLLVRDPVVLLIYLLALRARIFPYNIYVISLAIIALLSWPAGIIVLLPYFPIQTVILVTGYGLRSNFLHLPLIFIIPAVFDLEDVKRVGRWTIIGMIPMAVLMAFQFAASPESLINRAAGLGEGTQIQAGGGQDSATGCLFVHLRSRLLRERGGRFSSPRDARKTPLQGLVALRSGRGIDRFAGRVWQPFSGARGSCRRRFARRDLACAACSREQGLDATCSSPRCFSGPMSYLPVFREGVGILSDRFTESAAEASVVGGLVGRTVGGFTEGLLVLNRVPLGGYGLGVGTSGGASFLTGEASFLLAENEWSRILLESGPILGLAFLIWRSALTFKLGHFAIRQIRAGNTLPIFLFSAGLFVVLQGPFGQPTSLGFAVVFAGLCLAARPLRTDMRSAQRRTGQTTAPSHAPLQVCRATPRLD